MAMNNTRSRIHAIFILIITVVGAAGIFFLLLFLHEKKIFLRNSINTASLSVVPDPIYNKTLTSGSLAIPVSIADTEASREQGLSGTPDLPAHDGKLFVFPTSGNQGFWMKDMNYSLDFVWIGSDMKIVGITPNVAADTYPKIFYSPQPVQYVLEVNAGFSAQYRLHQGQQFILQ
jgi:uncharacterized membrane protein (UPF0127 family)